MARPRKHKRICKAPEIKSFNSEENAKDVVEITVDELETVRLIDFKGLTQQACAKQMQVARSTITSIYENARYKISDSILCNKELRVNGGEYELCENSGYCCGQCGKSKCRHCKHGKCANCIGIYHEPGRECYVVQH